MKFKVALLTVVTSFALVGLAPPANAQVGGDLVGTLIGSLATAVGIVCNAVNVVGPHLCK
ncbi:MAG TPA: hypothetical protein VII47_07495 [Actinomycetota bacterium]